jgi:hypothetical protein
MKKFFLFITIAGTMFLLNSCTTTGYVSSEPAYVEYSRPTRPSDQHIWIDGDWVWNRQSNVYVRNHGHWQKQRRGNVYIAGTWQSSPQGLYWQSGHWQR